MRSVAGIHQLIKNLAFAVACGWLLSAAISQAAPDFALSGRVEELRAMKVAEDSGRPVSAWEVLLYLDMARKPLTGVSVKQWLGEGDQMETPRQLKRERIEEYLAALSLAREGNELPSPDFVKRDMTYTAAIAAWVQTQIIEKKEIIVAQTDINRYYIAHPELYSTDSRASVRYIFLPVADMGQLSEVSAAEDEMKAIREKISRGEITFGEAARQYSKAPSAADGGLIPEFTVGTHFAEFDFRTFAIKNAGDISPVFVGNDGVYLIQLLSKTPPSKVPMEQVEAEIRKTVERELVAPYYRFMYRRLSRDSYTQNLANLWSYAELKAPIATLGGMKLTRDQVIRVNPTVVNAAYEPQWSAISKETARWIEGEAILRDLERKKLASHPYIAEAAKIADVVVAAEAVLNRRVAWSAISTPESALKALGADVGTTPGVEQCRILQISLSPERGSQKEAGVSDVLENTMRDLSQTIARGYLPTRPEETEFAQALKTASEAGMKELMDELKRLRNALEQSPWSHIRIQIRDVGWKDSSPGLAWSNDIVGLNAGEIGTEQQFSGRVYYNYVLQKRIDYESKLLETPLFLQTVAYNTQRENALKAEITKIRARNVIP